MGLQACFQQLDVALPGWPSLQVGDIEPEQHIYSVGRQI